MRSTVNKYLTLINDWFTTNDITKSDTSRIDQVVEYYGNTLTDIYNELNINLGSRDKTIITKLQLLYLFLDEIGYTYAKANSWKEKLK
ncbi:hypothetical protein IZU99_08485 [Oscillospiraceae bacterium CM]|nr:hypothetical protein IZU99_08485 [Oscillospiraceae bacterium CM]